MTMSSKSRSIEAAAPYWLEWVTGLLSILLVLGMIGWIATEAILHPKTAPEFRSEILAIRAVKDGFRVEFEIFNDGTATAAAVEVRGELMEEDGSTETAEATFDYVPARSSAKGGFVFAQNPEERSIRIRAVGYTEP